jgi:UPF0755 protein
MIKKLLIIIVSLLFMGMLVVQQQITQFKQLSLTDVPKLYEVTAGTGVHRLCNDWLSQGNIESCFALQVYAKLYPANTSLKAGMYELQNLTVLEAIEKIHLGDQKQFSFTLIEGDTLKMVLSKLKSTDVIDYDIEEENLSALLNVNNYAEGWLLPETYFFHANTRASSIILRAHNAMKEELQLAWQNRMANLPLQNAYEALILASIIEKETGFAPERKTIASVFINRLNKNMRLQTDPTVIYGLGERFDGDIKRKDLKEHTPYNTYRINGLPPTPIAMPSKAAIIAATQPDTTDYYYFVAKGNGQHQFSKNLTDHNKAVRQYILKRSNDS